MFAMQVMQKKTTFVAKENSNPFVMLSPELISLIMQFVAADNENPEGHDELSLISFANADPNIYRMLRMDSKQLKKLAPLFSEHLAAGGGDVNIADNLRNLAEKQKEKFYTETRAALEEKRKALIRELKGTKFMTC